MTMKRRSTTQDAARHPFILRALTPARICMMRDEVTADDPLPMIVDMTMPADARETRLTEVRTETTDEN
jgi:hypothetical protein